MKRTQAIRRLLHLIIVYVGTMDPFWPGDSHSRPWKGVRCFWAVSRVESSVVFAVLRWVGVSRFERLGAFAVKGGWDDSFRVVRGRLVGYVRGRGLGPFCGPGGGVCDDPFQAIKGEGGFVGCAQSRFSDTLFVVSILWLPFVTAFAVSKGY